MGSKMGQAGGAGAPPPPPSGGAPAELSFDGEIDQKLLSTLADKLGTTADDLKSKLDSGADLRDLLDEKGVSPDDVRSAFQDAFKSWQSYGSSGTTSSSYSPEFAAVDARV